MAQNQRRASATALTYPLLNTKEIADLLHNALSINVSAADVANPSPQLVTKVFGTLAEYITDVPRQEVNEVIKAALDGMEYPEIYREGLSQLTLLREMEELCKTSLFQDFRLDDLVTPAGNRFVKILSAILNFGRFREDVQRQLDEQREGVVKLEKELQSLQDCQGELQESVQTVRDRLAKEAPERQRLMLEKEREESTLKTLYQEKSNLEKLCADDKLQFQQLKNKSDSILVSISSIESEIANIRGQIVSSPERIQASMQQLQQRVEQEHDELERLKEEERVLISRKEELRSVNAALENCLVTVRKVEEKAEQAMKDEEKARSRKATIDSHTYRVKELKQKEQEALREVQQADERNNRMNTVRLQKIKSAKDELKAIQREQENRERIASDDQRKASRLRADAASLRAQIERARVEHERAQAVRQSLFGDVLAAFDVFTQGIHEGVGAVEEACQRT